MSLDFTTRFKSAMRRSGAEKKDSAKNRPMLIIGCAPHLDDIDLTLIDGLCETMVCNRFFRCYPEPEIKPDYYCCADRRVWRREGDDVQKRMVILLLGDVLFDPNCTAHSWVPRAGGRLDDPLGTDPCTPPGVSWIGYRTIHKTGALDFSDNPDQGFAQAGTVAYDMLQWAAFLGHNPIGIIGVDLAWPKGTEQPGSRKPTHAGGLVGYDHDAFPLYTDYNLKYFDHAAKVLSKRGVQAFNLAPGGRLNAFPRKDFAAFADELSVR